mmetsp:Transcript_36654/g.80031  ORF Transcript_36654/g.80031 Transcript_36654/m.80031 type:complete len:232 (-) Transcript_36654:416-1111(-)
MQRLSMAAQRLYTAPVSALQREARNGIRKKTCGAASATIDPRGANWPVSAAATCPALCRSAQKVSAPLYCGAMPQQDHGPKRTTGIPDLATRYETMAQKRSMMKSPVVSAASPTQSTAASAPSAMPSPAVVATPPRSSKVASQPSSAMCSPSTTPATARPPTAPTAATFAPVLQPAFFSCFAGVECAGANAAGIVGAEAANASSAIGFASGMGTSMVWPTLADDGTSTEMN